MESKIRNLLKDVRVEPIKGGEILHAKLVNNEIVHIMKMDSEPYLYVAFGEMLPKYGSPPLSSREAFRQILIASI